MKKTTLDKLATIASKLDQIGLAREADVVDRILISATNDGEEYKQVEFKAKRISNHEVVVSKGHVVHRQTLESPAEYDESDSTLEDALGVDYVFVVQMIDKSPNQDIGSGFGPIYGDVNDPEVKAAAAAVSGHLTDEQKKILYNAKTADYYQHDTENSVIETLEEAAQEAYADRDDSYDPY